MNLMALLAAAVALAGSGLRAEAIHTRGLDLFFELGLPDTRGAAWVRVAPVGRVMELGTRSQLFMIGASGNGWLLKKHPDGTADVLFGQASSFRVRLTESEIHKNRSDDAPLVTVQEADLSADLMRLREAINGGNSQPVQGGQNSRRLDPRMLPAGEFVLMLAHLRRQGRDAEVEELLPGALQLARSPERTVSEAISLLADAQLAEAAGRWPKSHDPVEYARTLDALCDKYSQGWRNQDAVALLARRVREQKPGARVSDPDAKTAAAWLLAVTNSEWARIPKGSNWLLPQSIGNSDESPGMLRAFARQFPGAAAAARALAGLLDDGRMLRVVKPQEPSYESEDEAGEAERLRALDLRYEALARPLTIGEAAGELLEPILPETLRQTLREDRGGSIPLILNWLAGVEKMSDEELAWQILRGADSISSKDFLGPIDWLARNGNPRTLEQLKPVFLDARLWERPSAVDAAALESYLNRLREHEDTTPLEEKVLAAAKRGIEAEKKEHLEHAVPTGMEDGETMQRALAVLEKSARAQYRSIEQAVRPRRLADLLQELKSARDENVSALVPAIQSAAAKTSGSEAACFQAAASADSPVKKLAILNVVPESRNVAGAGAPPQPDAVTLKAIEELLESKETFQSPDYPGAPTESVADLAAAVFAWPRISPEDRKRLQMIIPEVASRALTVRAKALARGVAPPPLPDDSRIPPADAERLVDELSKLAPSDVLSAFGAKSPDEQLAVTRHLLDRAVWPGSLRAASLTVRTISGNASVALGADKWLNRQYDEYLHSEIESSLEHTAATGTRLRVSIQPNGTLFGMGLLASEVQRSQFDVAGLGIESSLEGYDSPPLAVLFCYVHFEGRTGVAFLPIWKDPVLSKRWRREHPSSAISSEANVELARDLLKSIPAGKTLGSFALEWQIGLFEDISAKIAE